MTYNDLNKFVVSVAEVAEVQCRGRKRGAIVIGFEDIGGATASAMAAINLSHEDIRHALLAALRVLDDRESMELPMVPVS